MGIIKPEKDRTELGCPTCNSLTPEEGCVYEFCDKHFNEMRKAAEKKAQEQTKK